MTIINDNARVINKLEASLTDDTRAVIYTPHMFIGQTTGLDSVWRGRDTSTGRIVDGENRQFRES